MAVLTGRNSKIVYLLMMMAAVILAILLKFGFNTSLSDFFSFGGCNDNNICLGNQAVYRVSFGSALGFFIIAIVCALNPAFHYDYWTIKLIGYTGFIIITFFIPKQFFDGYAEFARVVSIFFLLLQIIILIDFAHNVHDYLLEEKVGSGDESEENKCWKLLYLILSFALHGAALVGIGLLYHYFGRCDLHKFFISFTLILALIVTFISLLDKISVGLLVPGVVSAYCTFITWQAMYSNPNTDCNYYTSTFENPGMVIVGIIITAASLTYTSWSASVNAPNLFRASNNEDEPAELDSANPEENKTDPEDGKSSSNENAPKKPYWFFHVVMSMGAVYMAMLLTNWGVSSGGNPNQHVDVSNESMWIKIISVWLTFLLFLWTITAPYLFPDRDFTDSNNTFRKSKK